MSPWRLIRYPMASNGRAPFWTSAAQSFCFRWQLSGVLACPLAGGMARSNCRLDRQVFNRIRPP
jgi:hypothetical protein